MFTSTSEARIYSSYSRLAFSLALVWTLSFVIMGLTYHQASMNNYERLAVAKAESNLDAALHVISHEWAEGQTDHAAAMAEAHGSQRLHFALMNPDNVAFLPDSWEQQAINSFRQGETAMHVLYEDQGKPHIRIARPYHAPETGPFSKVNEAGALIGAISFFQPIDSYFETFGRVEALVLGVMFLFWLSGISICLRIWRHSVSENQRSRYTFGEIRRNARRSVEVGQASSRLLQNLNHRLRTPLQGIVANAELIMGESKDAEILEKGQSIYTCARDLEATIRDLGSFLDLETNRLSFSAAPADLSKLVRNVRERVQGIASIHNVELDIHVSHEAPAYLSTDARRLKEVLYYFLDFAIERSDGAKVRMDVLAQLTPEGDYEWSFVVSDSGTVLDQDALRQLFDPPSLQENPSGDFYETGSLRLAICSRIAEHLGAHVTAYAALDQGIQIRIDFSSPQVQVTQEGNHIEAQVSVLRDGKMLLISHEDDSIEQVEACAVSRLMRLVKSATVDEALRRLDAGERFDVIVYEPHPGSRNCTKLAQEVKQRTPQGSLPIVLLCDEFHLTPGAIQAYPFAYKKPLKEDAFMEVVAEAVEQATPAGTSLSAEKVTRMDDMASRYPMRILVADDNAVNRKVTSQLLKRLGYDCFLACNGKEAVDVAQAEQVDLILMDLDMPEMSGWQATSRLRAILPGPKCPQIVAVTAFEKEHVREVAIARGMDDFINKPVDLESLTRTIEKSFLRRKRNIAASLSA